MIGNYGNIAYLILLPRLVTFGSCFLSYIHEVRRTSYSEYLQVIPVGQPIAAVAADYVGDEPEDRLFNLFGGSKGPGLNILGGLTPSKGGGGSPSYKPRPSYGAPKPSYKPTNPR